MGGVLYQLIDIGADPTGFVGTQPTAEDVQPSMNWRLLETGEWFQTTVIAE